MTTNQNTGKSGESNDAKKIVGRDSPDLPEAHLPDIFRQQTREEVQKCLPPPQFPPYKPLTLNVGKIIGEIGFGTQEDQIEEARRRNREKK